MVQQRQISHYVQIYFHYWIKKSYCWIKNDMIWLIDQVVENILRISFFHTSCFSFTPFRLYSMNSKTTLIYTVTILCPKTTLTPPEIQTTKQLFNYSTTQCVILEVFFVCGWNHRILSLFKRQTQGKVAFLWSIVLSFDFLFYFRCWTRSTYIIRTNLFMVCII